jgi:uncharacterized protein with PIN domain
MFLDASVIVAIIAQEAGYEVFQSRLTDSDGLIHISAIVRFEAVQAIARIASTPGKHPLNNWQMRERRSTACSPGLMRAMSTSPKRLASWLCREARHTERLSATQPT